MLNKAEFELGSNITVLINKQFFKGRVDSLYLDPITNVVEYVIKYKPSPNSKGNSKILCNSTNIKESINFKGK